jgi:hypothetical protein
MTLDAGGVWLGHVAELELTTQCLYKFWAIGNQFGVYLHAFFFLEDVLLRFGAIYLQKISSVDCACRRGPGTRDDGTLIGCCWLLPCFAAKTGPPAPTTPLSIEIPQLCPGTLPSSFLLPHSSQTHHVHPSIAPLSATPSPHVTDIAAIREGVGQQARGRRGRPPMAGCYRPACSRAWSGMRSCARSAPLLRANQTDSGSRDSMPIAGNPMKSRYRPQRR